ncbi:MAG: 50S ribosomal protein L25/general stress protein Ctc [Candidatus Muproteobacteria bacterium RBG_16_62_13]|uniref:Large ribosomal subunit protein bL25 n=1 Tax=Candidatus Muproteobacteria bacterium RBG_16_62_13 TaxID=1817756 RepID=A0A1F6T0N7_9PROT|nr:MAG: 50S ribosomal protein L25/general stress protein Ctc [Candidatus Muproteobacteria bacterium RBG_16_62_13]
MSAKFELTAEPRAEQGKGASRRLRHAGRVPAILYGAGKPPQMVTLDHNSMLRNLENERFHTAIMDIKVGNDTDQAILRDWQMHPFKPQVLHIDLQRISATEKLHMRIPLHFTGADVAPGVKQDGGIVAHLMTDVDITCLPKDLPEFLTVDLSHLQLNQSVHLSDIKLPEGVGITSLAHGGTDLAVAAINIIREEVVEVPVAVVPAEGEAAAAAAPAEGEAKKVEGEAKKAEPAAKKPEKKEGK